MQGRAINERLKTPVVLGILVYDLAGRQLPLRGTRMVPFLFARNLVLVKSGKGVIVKRDAEFKARVKTHAG